MSDFLEKTLLMKRFRRTVTAAFKNCVHIVLFLTIYWAHASYAFDASQDDDALIPIEVFAALPSFSNVRISSSGKKIAFFTEESGRRYLIVQDIDGENGFQVPPPDGANYSRIRWASDKHILLQARMTLEREIFDDKTTETRWFSLDVETKKFIWLGKPKLSQKELTSQTERIVDMLPDDPDHILLELDFNLDGRAEVYFTNVTKGHRRLKRHPIDGVQNWYTDKNSQMRLGSGYHRSRWVVKYMEEGGFWKDLTKTDWSNNYTVQGFASKPDTLFVRGVSSYGTMGIYELNLKTEEVTNTVRTHPSVDIDTVFENPQTGQIEGMVYTDDFTRVEYTNSDMIKIQSRIDKALPNTVNSILSSIRLKNWYVVLSENSQNPGDYYIFDRSNSRLVFLGKVREQIDPSLMAKTESVSIPMRDNSHIPGYLTIPHNSKPLNFPTIVMPHGGPIGVRDTAEWDYEAQFYASRGYLVLKPNYRGSGGYGPAFEQAGKRQWGGLMQNDVTDATKWLIAKGYADPNRICIVGSSYGGYAALMGIIQEPELYQCAISTNGVTNLPALESNDRRTAIGGRSWTQQMGLKDSDDKDVSPYHRAVDITKPVLLMASLDDARVPWEHSQDMHKRLERLNKDSYFVAIKDGTHNMVTAQSRSTALAAAETFLKKHIGN